MERFVERHAAAELFRVLRPLGVTLGEMLADAEVGRHRLLDGLRAAEQLGLVASRAERGRERVYAPTERGMEIYLLAVDTDVVFARAAVADDRFERAVRCRSVGVMGVQPTPLWA